MHNNSRNKFLLQFARLDAWYIDDAVHLLCGQAPDIIHRTYHIRSIDTMLNGFIVAKKKMSIEVQERFRQHHEIMLYVKAAIDMGKIHCSPEGLVEPAEFIKWALCKDLPVPEELRYLGGDSQPNNIDQLVSSEESKKQLLKYQHGEYFTCDNVTSWDQVILKIVNDYMIEISAEGKDYNKEYSEIGFSGMGKGPSVRWELLKQLAKGNGMIKAEDIPYENRDDLKKRISQLRKDLKKIFPNINDDPFDPWTTVNGYRTRFSLYLKNG